MQKFKNINFNWSSWEKIPRNVQEVYRQIITFVVAEKDAFHSGFKLANKEKEMQIKKLIEKFQKKLKKVFRIEDY